MAQLISEAILSLCGELDKMIPQSKLDFWIQNNLNVLFWGKHGVGKSSIVIDAFNRTGLRWKYFSASTMDPWVDFIGVPKEKQNGDGSYLELIRPKEFQNDEIEALFFDEFGRGHKKVRNAVLELIQFKSINGKKFKNLRIIWAATNPKGEDDTYDVEQIDKAQTDRFHVQVEIPYIPHLPYFMSHYGSETARAAIDWWKQLPEKIKDEVSPRRLDYALDFYHKNGDMRDILPQSSNVSKLITAIQFGSISNRLKQLCQNDDQEESRQFISNENNFSACIDEILKQENYMQYFFPLLEMEKLVSLMSKNKKARDFIIDHHHQFIDLIMAVCQSGANKTLAKQVSKPLNLSGYIFPSKETHQCVINEKHKHHKSKHNGTDYANYDELILKFKKVNFSSSSDRKWVFFSIKNTLPANLSKNQAIQTLEILSLIIRRSYSSTLKRWKDLISIINSCFFSLYNNGETDIRDIQKKHITIGKTIDYAMENKNKFFFQIEPK